MHLRGTRDFPGQRKALGCEVETAKRKNFLVTAFGFNYPAMAAFPKQPKTFSGGFQNLFQLCALGMQHSLVLSCGIWAFPFMILKETRETRDVWARKRFFKAMTSLGCPGEQSGSELC